MGMNGQNNGKEQKRILVIEDDLQVQLAIRDLMRSVGYDAVGESDWWEALRLMKENPFDLAIVDIHLSRVGTRPLTGLDLIPLLRTLKPRMPVVVMSAYGDQQFRATGLKQGAAIYLEKPVEPVHLMRIVRRLLDDENDVEQIAAER